MPYFRRNGSISGCLCKTVAKIFSIFFSHCVDMCIFIESDTDVKCWWSDVSYYACCVTLSLYLPLCLFSIRVCGRLCLFNLFNLYVCLYVSTATNERARIDHQPSEKFSSARDEPSMYVCIHVWLYVLFFQREEPTVRGLLFKCEIEKKSYGCFYCM